MPQIKYKFDPIALTEKNCPEHVVMFTAKNMIEAMWKADQALRQAHVQAAIWSRPVQDNAEMLAKSGTKGFEAKSKSGRTMLDWHKANLFPKDERQALLKTFNTVSMQRRAHIYGNFSIDPHYDCDSNMVIGDQEKMFQGHRMRILVTRRGPGTYIYDKSDLSYMTDWGVDKAKVAEECQPLEVAQDNIIFLAHLEWGLEKALLHDAPQTPRDLETPRIVDVYTCQNPISVKEFEKLKNA